MKKTVKEVSTIIPPDLKEICRVKEGQLAQQINRKKAKSSLKKIQCWSDIHLTLIEYNKAYEREDQT